MADLKALRSAVTPYLDDRTIHVLEERETDRDFVVNLRIDGEHPLHLNVVGHHGFDGVTLMHLLTITPEHLSVLPLPTPGDRLARFERAVGEVILARSGLVHCRVDRDGEGCQVVVTALVYRDGLSRHTFMTALTEVGKARAHIEQMLRFFAEVRGQAVMPAAAPAVPAAPAGPPPVEPARPPISPPPFRPTHVVGPTATGAWAAPDASTPSITSIGPGTQLQMIEQLGAWAHVRVANGWEGWVDGRLLQQA